jgi:hypothetical protein
MKTRYVRYKVEYKRLKELHGPLQNHPNPLQIHKYLRIKDLNCYINVIVGWIADSKTRFAIAKFG